MRKMHEKAPLGELENVSLGQPFYCISGSLKGTYREVSLK